MNESAKGAGKFDTFDLLSNICQVLAPFNNRSPFTFEMVQADVYVETGQKAKLLRWRGKTKSSQIKNHIDLNLLF